jgi:DNA-binding Xre family transcriptional regulator
MFLQYDIEDFWVKYPIMTEKAHSVVLSVEPALRCSRMITGAQIRAARALLGWTAADLAERSGLSTSSIQRAEAAQGVASIRADNLFRLQRALEEAGIIFIYSGECRPGGDGVRFRSSPTNN